MINFTSNTIQAHVAARTPDGKIKYLLLKRSPDNPVYPNIWQVITGRIEENETAVQAAIRELREETALLPLKMWTIPYLAHFFNPRKNEINASPVFAFFTDYIENISISNEHSDFLWADFNNAINRLELPSHKEGTKLFREYILNNIETPMFKIDLRGELNNG